MTVPAAAQDDAGEQIGSHDRLDKEEREQSQDETNRRTAPPGRIDMAGIEQSQDETNRWIEFLDSGMRELVEANNLPNAAIALVKDGDIVFLEGYGYADIERNIEADPRGSIFRTGSVAKIFTWTAVMQLVEQGLIDLDSDVNEYLDFELPGRIHGNGRRLQPAPITMRHLLSHTAGFEDVLEGLFLLREEDFKTLRKYLITRIPARIYPPGTVMAYSNWGTALAGYIVERLSGIPFGEYIEEHIFAPLGMESSTFAQPLPGPLADRLVGAYRYVDGQFLEGEFEFMPAPAGGLSTTAEDMARFMIAHLTGGGTILGEETVRQMHSLLFTHHALLGGMAHGFMEYTANGHRVVYHSGSSMLFDAGLEYVGNRAGTLIGEMRARRLVLFHAALLLLMLASLANAGRPDPVYLLPLSAAGVTSVFTCLTVILPVILGLLSVPVVVFCFFAWKRRWWRLPWRIHYSLYTLAAAGMTWFFWYYNSLGI